MLDLKIRLSSIRYTRSNSMLYGVISVWPLKYTMKSLTQSSLYLHLLEAAARDFHLARSVATWGAVFKSCREVRLHVPFGGPLFPFPSGVHLRVTLGNELKGMRRTWPNHRQRLVWMNCDIVVVPVLFNSFSCKMVFGQKILRYTSEGFGVGDFKFFFQLLESFSSTLNNIEGHWVRCYWRSWSWCGYAVLCISI